MPSHQLYLPLPHSYGGENGVYLLQSSEDTVQQASETPVDRYLEDLCEFLRASQLIQQHPETFLDYIQEEGVRSGEEGAEVQRLLTLCREVSTCLSTPGTEMRHLLAHGPPSSAGDGVAYSFFQQTRSLMLERRRREAPAVVDTLRCHAPEMTETWPVERENKEEEERRNRILELVLSQGMGQKKQHEVSIMRRTTSDLVKLCAHHSPSTQTVINIGEGKGYVSRALSLCDGISVVGLDCNPQHQEGALTRWSELLERSLSTSQFRGSTTGPLLNLLYQPRGHMTCISCAVEDPMDWTAVLAPHLPVAVHGAEAVVPCPSPSSPKDEEVFLPSPLYGRCVYCGAIFHLHDSASLAVKHIEQHLSKGKRTSDQWPPPLSSTEVQQWRRSLPLEDYQRKVTEAGYTVLRVSQAGWTELEEEEVCHWRRVLIGRGIRVVLWLPTNADGATWIRRTGTILGYDQSSQTHHVLLDPSEGGGLPQQERRCRLLGVKEGTEEDFSNRTVLSRLQDVCPVGAALVEKLLPFPAIHISPLQVPSLSNAVMIGLHTCGDLGANICRLWASSHSPGLLMVSCCWNRVTERNFPLSHAFQRRGLTLNLLSVQLATQPLDMWTTADTHGHRSSSRVHFLRGLLKVFWRRAEKTYTLTRGEARAAEPFPPCPHLDPVFLRKISRAKDVITFREFCEEVVQHYILRDPHPAGPAGKVLEQLFREGVPEEMEGHYVKHYFNDFLAFTILRMWMCHLVETALLLDRVMYLQEELVAQGRTGGSSRVSLVPLFDGALSPRLYGILAARIPTLPALTINS